MTAAFTPTIAGLYAITCERPKLGRSHIDVAAAALEGGASMVQLRDKTSPDQEFAEVAAEIQRLCREAGATFVVNDRASVAMRLHADGLHLGQADLRALDDWKPTWPALLGLSCNGWRHAQRAHLAGADYIGCGPVFPTSSEHAHKRVIGVRELERVVSHVPMPVAAIGGIKAGNIAEVAARRPSAICVMSAIADAPDMTAAARSLARAIAYTTKDGVR